MIWDHIHMLLDLPATRNLACNFCAISDMVLSSNKSMEPSPRRKDWPCQGKGCKLFSFSKTSCLTSPAPVTDSSWKAGFSDAHTRELQRARRRDCFSDSLAHSFSVSLLYTKRTALMHHWYNWACDTTHEGSPRNSCVSLSLPDRCPSAVTFLFQGGPDSVVCESIWRMWCTNIY